MAEKFDEASSSFSQNLTCPLCLVVFEDATLLTCGHTFCRKCLQMYDDAHKDLDHMVCPVCRKVTAFDLNRVSGLPANVTVKGLVEEQSQAHGGPNTVSQLKCTACDLGRDAVSYCTSCSYYLCDTCHDNHQKFRTSIFKWHQILSIQDIIAGKLSMDQLSNKCSLHSRDDKDVFCEDCKVYICLKCMMVSHREHKLKNQPDFERELQQKVDGLAEHCKAKKTELETNIQNIETRRQEVHVAFKEIQDEVRRAYNMKAQRLKDNESSLLEGVSSLQREFDDALDALKAHDRQRIKSIDSSVMLVANDRLRHLETDSLAAHSVICDELDGLLKEATDDAAAALLKNARESRFLPADDSLIHLGKVSSPPCHVSKEVFLPNFKGIHGMTRFTGDSVVVTVVHCNGNIKQLPHLPALSYYDIAFQSNKNAVVSLCGSFHNGARVYTNDGSHVSTMNIPSSGYFLTVSTSPAREILVVNGSNQVDIFTPDGTNLKQTLATKANKARQAFATNSGLIVTSSCDHSPSSTVTVYDRDGNAGDSLKAARDGELLYPAVDSQDRVYVARVHQKSGTMNLTRYDIQGLNLKENADYGKLELTLGSDWCYLASLSHNMLALACSCKLYFIKVPL